MAVLIDNNGKCHSIAGPDMNSQANFEVQDPSNNNGLIINY